jgi:epsilon-lactone hydrolase
MSDPEIVALREVIAKRVRSDDIAQRRRDIDARGQQYKLAADIAVEPVNANGVKSEWTTAPDAQAGNVVLFLHGGGYVIGSLQTHDFRNGSRRAGTHLGDRLPTCAGAPLPRGG